MAKPSVEALEGLFSAVVGELARRIEDDEASAADIANAIKLLKDNSITAVIEDNSAMSEMQKKLTEMRERRGKKLVAVPEANSPVSTAEAEDAVEFAMNRAAYGS